MKSIVGSTLLLLLVTIASALCAQDVHYLDTSLKNVKKKKNASYIREFTEIGANRYEAKTLDTDGNLRFTGEYLRNNERFVEDGEFIFYHTNGNIESKGRYQNGIKVGPWERYTSSGQRKPDRYYNPESADLIRSVMEN